ncbi:hypothetical protein [Tatumella sp. OPLPL6]|uniref:hypothetical protein n=1 Tax=Tatumella sp. OPLPL6 TaxID=1928657 RepID=UPI000C1853BC|nr:hypothetical protein [Tatumella sp. OPLPL6]PIJ42641.1 hypothetical protein BOM24_12415 [Tatumella sp. OPLPL6]
MDNIRGKNNFVRLLIVLFCVLLVVMVIFHYFFLSPKGEISSGVITLLLLLLVLILSEGFDNFSLGKLISISREVKEKEQEVDKLEKANSELLNQVIKFTSTQNQNQTQQHTNVYGDYHAGKGASVERASEQEVEAKASDEPPKPNDTPEQVNRTDFRKVESIAMQKYISDKGIHSANVIREAKLVTQFHGIDPISNNQPIFDGYYKSDEREIFIEFKINRSIGFMLTDRVYVMLSKINHYRNAKGVNAYLDLVLLKLPDDEGNYRFNSRFMQNFEPAIASGLLRINEIELSKEEIDSCKREL